MKKNIMHIWQVLNFTRLYYLVYILRTGVKFTALRLGVSSFSTTWNYQVACNIFTHLASYICLKITTLIDWSCPHFVSYRILCMVVWVCRIHLWKHPLENWRRNSRVLKRANDVFSKCICVRKDPIGWDQNQAWGGTAGNGGSWQDATVHIGFPW